MTTVHKADFRNLYKQNKKSDDNDAFGRKKEKRNQTKKLKQLMRKRLIIRNLSFQVSEEKLKEIFSKYGEVLDVKIPLKSDGKKRGFAFVQYKDTKSQVQAMKALNFKKILGRPVAIDYAVDKVTYQTRMQKPKPESDSHNDSNSEELSESGDSDKEDDGPCMKEESTDGPRVKEESSDGSARSDDDEEDEDKKVKSFLKEFDAEADVDEPDDASSDESSEDEGDDEEELSQRTTVEKPVNRKHSNDVSEGKTVFIRNLSFKNTEEDLQDFMQEYGMTEYCLLCIDPITNFPKGTAFVKFKEREGADKLLEESSKEPGILLDGRKLLCTPAVSREDVSKLSSEDVKVKDKRNLRLLKCGLIMQGSQEAEGVSPSDMAKRLQLEMMKKQKLRNVNFFVSDLRLAVHNLPQGIQDKQLRAIFRRASRGADIKEARVMKDFKKTDAQGHPVSKGFGFVSFTRHEDALKALMEINNHPSIFTPQKRPIVEFSIENKVALLTQERRKQHQNKKRNEEKMVEEKKAVPEFEKQAVQKLKLCEKPFKRQKNFPKRKPSSTEKQQNQEMRFSKLSKKPFKRQKNELHFQKRKPPSTEKQQNVETGISKSKRKRNKSPRKKHERNSLNKKDRQSMTEMANKYKKKLFNQL